MKKLEGSYDVPQLKQKLNEIIDYLNSQDQEEEITAEQLCEDNRKRMERLINKEMEERGFIRKIKDTPEQKEEWEEELGKLMSTWGKVLFVNKGRIGVGMQTAMYLEFYHFIKNLLVERERWAIDTFLKDTASYNSFHNGRPRTMRNGLSGEGFEVRVSKLNK